VSYKSATTTNKPMFIQNHTY